MKFIAIFLEFIGWLQIVAAAGLVTGLIAGLVFMVWTNETGKTFAIVIVAIGLLTGMAWATRVWIKHGTTAWLPGTRKTSGSE